MSVDNYNHDRSYLFGRLLAIYEDIERTTYDKTETRVPNAVKLRDNYLKRPLYTNGILEKKIIPYLSKHTVETQNYYTSVLSEIMEIINDTNNIGDTSLKESYIFGYYQQLKNLNQQRPNKGE